MPVVRRLAQIALGVPFVVLGTKTVTDPEPRAYAAASLGLPEPLLATRATGAAMITGGIALGFNILPRTAALGLAASLVPTTLLGHQFWEETEPQAHEARQIHFVKNIGILGGLLTFVAASRSWHR